jgi:hypothetical protein
MNGQHTCSKPYSSREVDGVCLHSHLLVTMGTALVGRLNQLARTCGRGVLEENMLMISNLSTLDI